MQRLLTLTFCLLYSCLSLASSNYQIDLIIFTHLQNNDNDSELKFSSPLLPISPNVIQLKTSATKSTKSYQLLSSSMSTLRDEYYQLNRKKQYHVLGLYSWIQPGANQSTVALPFVTSNGWQMQGTIRVRQSNYYLVNAELQLSSPKNPQSFFTVSQKQRLKGNVVYYLDHPQVGMLIKIHKLA